MSDGYISLSHWGLHKVEGANMSIKDDLNDFYNEYHNTTGVGRSFKKGQTVLYYNENVGWVTAVILRKHGSQFADLAYVLEDEVMMDFFISTHLLMKSPE